MKRKTQRTEDVDHRDIPRLLDLSVHCNVVRPLQCCTSPRAHPPPPQQLPAQRTRLPSGPTAWQTRPPAAEFGPFACADQDSGGDTTAVWEGLFSKGRKPP
jgi:hypothetical protein